MPSAVPLVPDWLVLGVVLLSTPLWHLKSTWKGISRLAPALISPMEIDGNTTCGVTVVTAQVG